jgi:hypothetical protein
MKVAPGIWLGGEGKLLLKKIRENQLSISLICFLEKAKGMATALQQGFRKI